MPLEHVTERQHRLEKSMRAMSHAPARRIEREFGSDEVVVPTHTGPTSWAARGDYTADTTYTDAAQRCRAATHEGGPYEGTLEGGSPRTTESNVLDTPPGKASRPIADTWARACTTYRSG